MAAAKKIVKKPVTTKFTLNCDAAVRDSLIDTEDLKTYLHSHIKVDNKTGNFEKVDKATGEVVRYVTITNDLTEITVEVMLPFKKRYLKYLTKRYICMAQLRDFIRVVAVGKKAYALKYFAAVKEGVKA